MALLLHSSQTVYIHCCGFRRCKAFSIAKLESDFQSGLGIFGFSFYVFLFFFFF